VKVSDLPKQPAPRGTCCAMKLSTRHNSHDSSTDDCPWRPIVMLAGKPLCWTHFKAVEAGYRSLPT